MKPRAPMARPMTTTPTCATHRQHESEAPARQHVAPRAYPILIRGPEFRSAALTHEKPGQITKKRRFLLGFRPVMRVGPRRRRAADLRSRGSAYPELPERPDLPEATACVGQETCVDDGCGRRDTNGQQCSVARPFLDDLRQRRRQERARDARGGGRAGGCVGRDEPAARAAGTAPAPPASASPRRPAGRRRSRRPARGSTPRPSGSSAAAERDVERALLLVRAAPGAQRDRARLRLDQHEHPPRGRDGVAQPRRPDHHDRRAPFRPAQHGRQRRRAAERARKQGSLDAHLPSSGRETYHERADIHDVLRSARPGGAARQDRRQGAVAAPPRRGRVARAEGDRRDDRSAGDRCARAARTLPMTLAAPGALTTVEGAARALAAAPWPEGFASALAREIDTLVPEPGARYAVRSSASIEDQAGVLAAGLFLSRVDVARGEVLEAVRAGARVRALPGGRRLSGAARAGHRPPRLRGADSRVHRGRGGGRGRVRPRARRSRRRSRCRPERRRRSTTRARARIEQAVRALASTHGAVELEWVVSRRPADVPAAAAPAIAGAHAGARRGDGRAAVVRSAVRGQGSRPERHGLALGRGPQSAAAVARSGGPGVAGRRAVQDRPAPARGRRVPVLRHRSDVGDHADWRRRRPARPVGGGAAASGASDADAGAGAGDLRRHLPAAVRRRAAELARRDAACWRRSCAAAGSIRRRCCPSCCRAFRRRRRSGRGARARWRRRSIPSCARRRWRRTWRSSATRRRAGTSPRRPGASGRRRSSG